MWLKLWGNSVFLYCSITRQLPCWITLNSKMELKTVRFSFSKHSNKSEKNTIFPLWKKFNVCVSLSCSHKHIWRYEAIVYKLFLHWFPPCSLSLLFFFVFVLNIMSTIQFQKNSTRPFCKDPKLGSRFLDVNGGRKMEVRLPCASKKRRA